MNNNKYKLNNIIIITLILSLSILSRADDYGFFYDNINEEILFDTDQTILSNYIFKEEKLLNSSNKEKEYFSSAKKNRFKMEYFSCPISSISTTPFTLIRASFNITEPINTTVKEVIMDLHNKEDKKLVFPNKYFNEFIVEQNKSACNDGRKRRNTIIYDTFGFNIKSKNNFNFKIAKIILVNFRKGKLNYLANLSGNVQKTYIDDNNVFDIYLKNLPENFDLYITLEIFDKNWETTGEKILVVQKDFKYPNYRVESVNPNHKMFIISLTFIIIAFILTVVFVILKFICGIIF